MAKVDSLQNWVYGHLGRRDIGKENWMVVLLEGGLGAWEGPLMKMDGMHLSCMPMDCTHKWVT